LALDFEQILQEHRDRLVRIARRYALADDWQDLYQDMAMNIWRGLAGFDGRAAVSTWIYRVAVNTALQHVRRRRAPMSELPEQLPGATGPGEPMEVLDAFLRSLDPINRAVLLLDLEGASRDEIAEVMGTSPGAIAVRMTRLRARFNDQFVEDA
jgi:RNA polymerase sigma-70 factor (ECF subfamily)